MHEDKILTAQVINQQAQEYIEELELTRYVSKKNTNKREYQTETVVINI